MVFVAIDMAVLRARLHDRPEKCWGFRGRMFWYVRMTKQMAIWTMLTSRAAKKYSFQPILCSGFTPVTR